MPTTHTTRLPVLILGTALSLLGCEEDAERPTIDIAAIEPDPLPPDASQPGAPGSAVTPGSKPSLDAGVSTPAPPPRPVVDAGRDAALPLPSPSDPFGFDAAIPGATVR